MFGQRKKLIVNKKDLNQAVLVKNKAVSRENNKLADNIKSKKTELKETSGEVKKAIKELSALELEIKEASAVALDLSNDIDTLKVKNKKLKKDEKASLKSLSEVESSMKALNDKKSNLESQLLKDEKKAGVMLSFIEENKGIQDEISGNKKSLKSYRASVRGMELNVEKMSHDYSLASAKHDSDLASLKDKLNMVNQAVALAEKDHNDSVVDFKVKEVQLKADIEVLNGEKGEFESVIGNIKSEYASIEESLREKEDDIKRAEYKASKIIEEANESAGKIRENFKAWKVNMLSQVAKLQLKGKIDIIDKAGLADILNG
ncbi:MAG: hypothetical protein H8E74_01185 [Gammaproteobacteria bacterium]|nr:hypothetical protein [Gammaproteobacteria bacterium]